jgi:hypothetical protein
MNETAAERPDLFGRKPAQVAFERLRPHPERHRGAERVAPGAQNGDTPGQRRRQCLRQSRLADARVAPHHHRAEGAGGRMGELRLQGLDLALAPDGARADDDVPGRHGRIMGQPDRDGQVYPEAGGAGP